MLRRFRQSLAVRLAVLYAVLFAAATAVIFGGLYWTLSRSIISRDRLTLEARTGDYARAYSQGGLEALRDRVDVDPAPDGGTLFVRVIAPGGASTFVAVPPSWVDPKGVLRIVPFGWMGWRTEETHSVRIPQDAARDYMVASRMLADGHLLQVARRTDSQSVLLAPLRRDFVRIGTAALLLSLVIGTWVAWRATRPLRAMANTARRIVEQDDMEARVPSLAGAGELALLSRQLNALLDKNAEHVRVLRETLDNLAHDLRTPLTRLRGTAEMAMQHGTEQSEERQALANVLDESDRVLHLLETLLDVSVAEAGAFAIRREALDLRAAAERAVALFSEVAEERRIRLDLAPGTAVPVVGDAVRLGQAISNLLDNALKYTPEGGTVEVTAESTGGAALLRVDDSGPGVPAAERTAIWRRLYRGDASRSQRGLGLGLTLVRAIAEAHGGTASVTDRPGGGARFELRLPTPVAATAAVASAAP